MDFLFRNPFVRLLIPLVAGILTGSGWNAPPWWLLMGIGLLATLFLLFHTIVEQSAYFYRFRFSFGVGVWLILYLFGWIYSASAHHKSTIEVPSDPAYYVIQITDKVEERSRSVLVPAQLLSMVDSLTHRSINGKLALYFAKDSASLALQSGDIIVLNTLLQTPRFNHNPESFNYAKYLRMQGICATAYVASGAWRTLHHQPNQSLKTAAFQTQQRLLRIYQKYAIQGDEFSVLAALTLGSKEWLDLELQQSYAASGAMHILAVSGLHVGIIFVILQLFFKFLDRWRGGRAVKSLLIILLLWIYAFITGLSPSVMRATLMFSVVQMGVLLNRPSHIYNTIAFSAFLMLLINPMILFHVGFQLSYSALLAIIYFQPKIAKLFYVKSPLVRWGWELISVSVAAQIGTLPWALLYFHQFSNYFILTNFVVIPAASLIIYTAVALFGVASIPFVGGWVACLLKYQVMALNYAIRWIEQLPFAISTVWVSQTQAMLLLLTIGFLVLFLERKQGYFLNAAMACLLLLVSFTAMRHYTTAQQAELIAYADSRSNTILLREGKDVLLLSDTLPLTKQLTKPYLLKLGIDMPTEQHLSETGISNFHWHDKQYTVVNSELLHRKKSPIPFQTDVLLLGAIGRTETETLFALIQPQKVVLLATMSRWKRKEYIQYCQEHKIAYYDIATKGAYSEMISSR